MTGQGLYGDDTAYSLPRGWSPVDAATLHLARDQARAALGGTDGHGQRDAVERVRAYYEPGGGYAGNLFLEVEPSDEMYISASDLWAVSTLSIKVPPLTGRRLLTPGPVRTNVTRQLRKIPPNLPISYLSPELLAAMWDLQDCLRSVMSTEERSSNWWVFASKMCTRKRPMLFPVRDSLVCRYLSGWKPLGGHAGRLGWFTNDIQVFAYLMTSPVVVQALSYLRSELLETSVATELDWSDMRLLDIALWTTARAELRARGLPADGDDPDDQTEDAR